MPGRNLHPALRAAAVCLAALLVIAVLFRAQLLSGFALTTTESYDGIIELSLFEHWFAVLRGVEPWHTTAYFHPYRGTLAYNDGFLLFGLVHGPLRWLGADPYASKELARAAMWLAGFLGLCGFMRAAFGVAAGWALLAGAMFALSSSYAAQAGHAQLFTVCLAPVLGWLLARLAAAATAGHGDRALAWGLGAAALLSLWLLTAFYMAWFTLFFALALLPAWLLAAGAAERQAAWRVLRVLGPARIAAPRRRVPPGGATADRGAHESSGTRAGRRRAQARAGAPVGTAATGVSPGLRPRLTRMRRCP